MGSHEEKWTERGKEIGEGRERGEMSGLRLEEAFRAIQTFNVETSLQDEDSLGKSDKTILN